MSRKYHQQEHQAFGSTSIPNATTHILIPRTIMGGTVPSSSTRSPSPPSFSFSHRSGVNLWYHVARRATMNSFAE
jgi:hypothetical protein